MSLALHDELNPHGSISLSGTFYLKLEAFAIVLTLWATGLTDPIIISMS